MKNILSLAAIILFSLMANVTEAQTATADNKLSQTITFRGIPKGPSVYGVFEGRYPCFEFAKQIKLSVDADCSKIKCDLQLYQDSITHQPSSFIFTVVGGGDVVKQDGGSYRLKRLEGKWTIIKGMKSNPDADIVQLKFADTGAICYLLKGDDNVLFVLDENKEFRVGTEDFSFTLNRVELVQGKR